MTSELQTYRAPADVRREMDAIRAQVLEVLPTRIDPDRFLRVVAKTIIGSPKLMACTRLSLLTSILTAAQLGLEPSGLLGSAYLVPFRRTVSVPHPSNPNATVKQKVMEAQLIPGYRGLIDLARRSGEILKVEARTVRSRDEFHIDYGQPEPIMHRPFIPDPQAEPEDRDAGPFVGAYMRAILRDDPVPQVEWMSTDEIESIRRRSRAADEGPWVTDWSEMARKTVVRRGAKYLPLTTDFRVALELDEAAERNADAPTQARPASRATQMLLDRAGASGTALDGPQTEEPVDEPAEAASDAPAQSDEPMPDPSEGTGEFCGIKTDEGTCSRSPGHKGEHK